ncbi:mannose-1-phosphate guanylyltransferase/mannose-6-phosphate isomerase [Vibrio sp. TH_r3]|uniref:mannose-1-phosphate guanylyltransferase/mannose-6-phosphate isomerase n=1 Tax=Vibrio sp. TH_r3 TaxID=3082084 RepID=UPI0029530318|nr:mannose-1-phosphate guanylyltransferase/mannose-6-phosphate isomerase [Vibrio sp. TH_r3]MDV7104203.1 mannose-1-phosphate guanylyltransferase/mannose-6-phosphate isomerase [Vibrio sp. TH_r3]
MFIPVIMAGGSGSRLWPLSRSAFPKQFLALDNSNKLTMLQSTLERLDGMDVKGSIIISNEDHRFIVAEQVRQFGQQSKIILEPAGRNTAPAIALAALQAIKNGDDPILLILAADHVVLNKQAFQTSVEKALSYAANNQLVTFGVVPSAPETGYGYIRRGEEIDNGGFQVDSFVEKPDKKTAEKYLKSPHYYWNSGCFMFKASVYLEELKKHSPGIYNVCKESCSNVKIDYDFIRVNESAFLNCPDDSVDYAVMEKTDKAVVVPMDAGWSDVGSWSALWEVSEKDINGNVIHGDAIIEDTENCYIYAPNKLVASVGVKNIVVVETKDAVLVADKSKVQEVKKVVENLKSSNRAEYREHREQYKPWGHIDAIETNCKYKVNRITIKPGEQQSEQMHYHRAEHWIVVSGTGKVTRGGEVSLITENQSIYIPIGVPHKIENPGKIPLDLIEVQSGTYLNEDDIVRLKQV